MANHTLVLELFYDGVWNAAPVYVRDGFKLKRGTASPGSDSEPASATLTIDNRSGAYSPRSVASSLYGKIGQNTRARLTIDSDVRLTGEVASWRPERAIKGDAWTKIEIAGVLQRIGRGTDPLDSAVRRYVRYNPTQPVAYWPLEGGDPATTTMYDLIANAPTQNVDQSAAVAGQSGAARFGTADLGPASAPVANTAGSWSLGMLIPQPVAATGASSWQWASGFGTDVRSGGLVNVSIRLNPAAAARHLSFQVYVFDNGTGQIDVIEADSSLAALVTTTVGTFTVANLFNGRPRAFQLDMQASGGTNVAWALWIDGTSVSSGTHTPTFAGAMNAAPYRVATLTSSIPASATAAAGHFAIYTSVVSAAMGDALTGHTGETAADRFTRLCTEQGITPTVVGAAADSLAMGPQQAIALLDLLDEIARTDDASIFETKTGIGLTMRTGASKLNQAPDFTINYLGQVEVPLSPVVGDEGIRNDVTAASPAGATRRVQQLTGPHNVQLPEVDPQGVGRYQTRINVNPATDDALSDAAGWRVSQGTFNGTWYAAITADLDAAPAITAAVNALDIGDVLAISNLPVDESLDTVDCLIIGIEEDVQPKRRTVTFFCVPAEPYRVGKLALTTGDTDPFVGHLETDGSTTVGSTAASAASISVATTSGPLWTTAADDFPFDVIAGGQRVSISAISGAASPQTFTVQTTGRQVLYTIPSGSPVNVQQPIILSM